MPQGRPLDERTVAAILASIDAGKSRNDVAREHGVSASTVSRIAAANGRSFDRSKTKRATEAKKADVASRRAAFSERLIRLAELSMDQALAELGEASARDAAVVLGIAVDKHLAVERHDNSGESHAAVDQWLQEMTGL